MDMESQIHRYLAALVLSEPAIHRHGPQCPTLAAIIAACLGVYLRRGLAFQLRR